MEYRTRTKYGEQNKTGTKIETQRTDQTGTQRTEQRRTIGTREHNEFKVEKYQVAWSRTEQNKSQNKDIRV